jgi:hypothetical protein
VEVKAGSRFGKLITIEYAGQKNRQSQWFCQCDCGSPIKMIPAGALTRGATQSCGCLKSQQTREMCQAREKSAVGMVFNGIEVLEKVGKTSNNIQIVKCKCVCGGEFVTRLTRIKAGTTKSCGCLKIELSRKATTKHGFSPKGNQDPFYNRLVKMLQRCNEPNDKGYPNYGGRGIKVYQGWTLTTEGISNFRNYILSLYPNAEELMAQGYELDRMDNDKGYEPGNLRLVTKSVNGRNKRNNIFVDFKGERRLLIDLYDEFKPSVTIDAVKNRLKAGYSLEEALTEPKIK